MDVRCTRGSRSGSRIVFALAPNSTDRVSSGSTRLRTRTFGLTSGVESLRSSGNFADHSSKNQHLIGSGTLLFASYFRLASMFGQSLSSLAIQRTWCEGIIQGGYQSARSE